MLTVTYGPTDDAGCGICSAEQVGVQLATQLFDAIALHIEQQHDEFLTAVASGDVQRTPRGLSDGTGDRARQ